MTPQFLEIDRLVVHFPVRGPDGAVVRTVRALNEVSLKVAAHEAVGIVGESGSGKSTLARAIVGLVRPSGGEIRVGGATLEFRRGAAARRGVQMIFQDPTSTLNPFQTVGQNLGDLIRYWHPTLGRSEVRRTAEELIRRVGLSEDLLDRHPHSLSGGQRQRVAIGRALAADPRLILCDEPTSALDVSVQAQILAVFADLKRSGQALVFISHNLAVVRQLCERIVVMRQGEIVEEGPADAIITAPSHPYTRALINAAPRLQDRGSLLQAARSATETATQ